MPRRQARARGDRVLDHLARPRRCGRLPAALDLRDGDELLGLPGAADSRRALRRRRLRRPRRPAGTCKGAVHRAPGAARRGSRSVWPIVPGERRATRSSRGSSCSAAGRTRATGSMLLLAALGAGFSPTLALVVLCLAAAASLIPVTSGGAIANVSATAAVLLALGVHREQAINFGLASGLLLCSSAGAAALIGVSPRRSSADAARRRSPAQRPSAPPVRRGAATEIRRTLRCGKRVGVGGVERLHAGLVVAVERRHRAGRRGRSRRPPDRRTRCRAVQLDALALPLTSVEEKPPGRSA